MISWNSVNEIYDIGIIDIRALRWGAAPVALLPKALRELWKEEPLPAWVTAECALPATATIEALGPQFWKASKRASTRVLHFATFLLVSRARSIDSIRCIS